MSIKRDGQQIEPVKYVCRAKDLDKVLPKNIKDEFQSLFYDNYNDGDVPNADAHRMFVDDNTPYAFFNQFGIDFDKPRVRDAVALDLIKLDDDSVSNSSDYTYIEHIAYSPYEYERMVLNRNYRVNIVNLEQEWTEISYGGGYTKTKRTVDRMYQGVRFSSAILGYFSEIFAKAFDQETGEVLPGVDIHNDIYIPFTSKDDITVEYSLVNNYADASKADALRSYYDEKYDQYRELLSKNGILQISTFALVDPDKDKTHIGEYLVKVQKWFSNGTYGYIVARIKGNGRFKVLSSGDIDIEVFSSDENTILCVCESDFNPKRTAPSDDSVWLPATYDVPMVKSTTSSQYSVFRQRIPDYDLKKVRHYNQFKTRLAGMEYAFNELNSNIYLKKLHISECFINEAIAISNLFSEFAKNKRLLELVVRYYDFLQEYDKIYVNRMQMLSLVDEKQQILNKLLEEYNALDNTRLDKKMDIGQKISSVKLELDKSLKEAIIALDRKLQQIRDAVEELNKRVVNIQQAGVDMSQDEFQEMLQSLKEMFDPDDEESEFSKAKINLDQKIEDSRRILDELGYNPDQNPREDVCDDDVQQFFVIGNRNVYESEEETGNLAGKDGKLGLLESIDTSKFRKLVDETYKWRDYLYALGFESTYLDRMYTPCEDALIKVKRLLKNFKERMEGIESRVWDDKHQLKENFSFVGIAVDGIMDIILLHDWYASNAPEKTYTDMGFRSEKKFMEFRKRCNKISYNLRKNQYAQLLEIDRTRLTDLITEITDQVKDRKFLKYKDKYGWDAKVEEEKPWSINDITNDQKSRISMFGKAAEYMKQLYKNKKNYEEDFSKLKDRTVKYLVDAGILEDESDLEKLVMRNRAMHYGGDVYEEIQRLQQAKQTLDDSIENLMRQRDAMKSILGGINSAKKKVVDLQGKNKQIVQQCQHEPDRQIKNRLLMMKLDNESRISDLNAIIEKQKLKNSKDISLLESMNDEVTFNQKIYDDMLSEFKDKIGLDEDAIQQLMIQIYNKYQDEILEHSERKNT